MLGPSKEASHFDLVTRGHRFILDVLPFRDPDSQAVLAGFVKYVTACDLPWVLVDALLVRCLIVLDRHTGGMLPTLVERYASDSRLQYSAVRFHVCIEDLLRYRGIADPLVARAVAEIDQAYADSALRVQLPEKLGVTSRALCAAFEQATGLTTGEYLRAVRLSQAARLLVETQERKVWASVGYNDPSNFVHDFQEHFEMTPGQYRKRMVPSRLPASVRHITRRTPDDAAFAQKSPQHPTRVLIIDDDEGCTETTARFLRAKGCKVATALAADEGMREASSSTPDVVLLDQWLGNGATGLEWLRALRQRLTRQPAIALVTADWQIQEAEARELGAFLIHKLCDLDQIYDTVVYLSGLGDPASAARTVSDSVVLNPDTGRRFVSSSSLPRTAAADGARFR